MRRTIIVLALCATFSVGISPTASAARYRSCNNVTKMVGGKKLTLATKVKVKGISCKDAKAVVIDYVVAGGMLVDPVLAGLRRGCKPDKKGQARPKRVGRIATTCVQRYTPERLKAWMLS